MLRFEKDATSPGSAKLGKLFVDVGAGVPAHAPRAAAGAAGTRARASSR